MRSRPSERVSPSRFVAPTLVGFLGLLGVMPGCSSSRPSLDESAPQTSITSVVVMGDSITFDSLVPIDTELERLGVTDQILDGVPGRPISQGIDAINVLVAEGVRPDAWVIALGTNDLGTAADGSGDAEGYRSAIASVLDVVPADAPIVWVNVFVVSMSAASEVFNLVLTDELDARGNAVIADWHASAAAAPQTLLRDDGVHPTQRGAEQFASSMGRGLSTVAERLSADQ